jgi:hypothetical protein
MEALVQGKVQDGSLLKAIIAEVSSFFRKKVEQVLLELEVGQM